MHLLAIETSGYRGGVALAEGGDTPDLVGEVFLDEDLRHARDLVPAMAAAFDRAGWSPRDLDAVAVSIGPGSFTGLRIAVILAKFVAGETGARIVTVPSLRALAENAPAGASPVACIRDAKRRGLYASVFHRRGEAFEETFGPALIQPADLAERLPAGTLVLGRGVAKAREALAGFAIAPQETWDVRPSAVARLGWQAHREQAFADPLRLEPLYLRRPEAEELWERRHGASSD